MKSSPTPQPSPSLEIVAHVDGGSRGNPGPAAYGVVVEDTPQGPRWELAR